LDAILTRGLGYRYEDGTVAIDGVDLAIREGDRVAVLGPNGAGKSTLLELFMGFHFPFTGSVEVFGQPLRKPNADLLRRRLGLLFQDPDDQIFLPRVWDDVAFGPINLKLDGGELDARVEWALKSAGAWELRDRVPHRLSYGQKKKVAIAGVLAMKPDVLLLDEPTGGLDPKSRAELIDVVNGLDKTLVVATHDVDAAVAMTKRAVVMQVRKLAEGGFREILSNHDLLDQANLEVPAITHLFQVLETLGYPYEQLPLEIDEAVEQITRTLVSGERHAHLHIHEHEHDNGNVKKHSDKPHD